MIYVDASECILSEQSHLVAVGPVEAVTDPRLNMNIVIQNRGSQPFTIDFHDISAMTEQHFPLYIYTYEELIKECESELFWNNVSHVLDLMGTSIENTFQKQEPYQPQGRQAYQQTLYTNKKSTYEFKREQLKNKYFRRQTILPGQQYSSFITVQLPKSLKEDEKMYFILNIPQSNDSHQLSFYVQRI
ncbi:MAG: hypothetical protein Tsb0021_11770 [Chlamydiales bacterium]